MTSERESRLKKVLFNRQFDITVVFENVHDPHNIAACLRSCDAVGIAEVYILSTAGKTHSKVSSKSSASASKWLSIHHYNDLHDCFKTLRSRYKRIYATKLSDDATDIYKVNFLEPVAIVFGNEKDGVSSITESLSDGNIIIPQVGMIRSLNISVACAVTLYEVYRQRISQGLYNGENPVFESMWSEWKQK